MVLLVVVVVPLEQCRWQLRRGLLLLLLMLVLLVLMKVLLMMMIIIVCRCRYRRGVGRGMTEESVVR